MKRKLQNQKDCPTKVKGFLEAFRTLLILLLCKLYSMYAPLDFTYDIVHHGHVHLIGTSVHYIVLCDSAICVHTLHSSFFSEPALLSCDDSLQVASSLPFLCAGSTRLDLSDCAIVIVNLLNQVPKAKKQKLFN